MVTNGQQVSVQAVESSDTIESLPTDELIQQATQYHQRVFRYLDRLKDITLELESRNHALKRRIEETIHNPISTSYINIPELDLIIAPRSVTYKGKQTILGRICITFLQQIALAHPNPIDIRTMTQIVYGAVTTTLTARARTNIFFLRTKVPIVKAHRGHYSLQAVS